MTPMEDNVVAITGASKGIGAELARQLAAQGAKLVLAARNEKELEAVAEQCRKAGFYASRLAIDLKYLDGGHWASEMRLVDTQDTKTFLHALEKLWSQRPRDTRTILKVGMVYSDLVSEEDHTGSLFASEGKSKSLYTALDRLNARFGKQAVYFASAHEARDRGGLHIAFNHIPDPETDK